MDPSSNNQPQPGVSPNTPPAGQAIYTQPATANVAATPQFDMPAGTIQTAPQPGQPQSQPVQNFDPQTYQQPFQNVSLGEGRTMPGQQPQAAPQAAPQATVGAPAAATAPAQKVTPGTKANPNSTQNTLQIAEIRDGIVIMNDGSFRSVVMVKSINFDLMSQPEQEAVEYSYQGFLNSLYFPVQIVIRSEKVDLQPYIEKLDKIRTEHDNMLLALLMNDYIGYIDQLAQQTNIMDKKFYIVVPYFPQVEIQKALSQSKSFVTGLVNLFSSQEKHVVINEDDLEKAKTELRNRVQAVLSGLLQSNIQGLPLDTQELIELFYDSYNPDTATRQQLKNFNNLTADVITKGRGNTVQPHMKTELNQ